jgi:hypothetical protein
MKPSPVCCWWSRACSYHANRSVCNWTLASTRCFISDLISMISLKIQSWSKITTVNVITAIWDHRLDTGGDGEADAGTVVEASYTTPGTSPSFLDRNCEYDVKKFCNSLFVVLWMIDWNIVDLTKRMSKSMWTTTFSSPFSVLLLSTLIKSAT